MKRIHFTDYEINFVNGITLQGIEEILTNQANTIEVLKIGLMVEPGETKQLKLPDLPRLKELSMNYKGGQNTNLKFKMIYCVKVIITDEQMNDKQNMEIHLIRIKIINKFYLIFLN